MLPTVTIRNTNTGQVVTIPRHKAASLGLPWVEVEAAPEPEPEPDVDTDPVKPVKARKSTK